MNHDFFKACKAPPSTPVVGEMNTEKAAAAALIGEKLSTNVDFQQFSYTKENTEPWSEPKDVKEVTVESYWIQKERAERAILSNFMLILE